MATPNKQSKAADTSSPNKGRGKRQGNNSPKKKEKAHTTKLEDTSTKTQGQHEKAANKPKGSSPKTKSPQKHNSPTKPPADSGDSSTRRPTLSRAYTSPMKNRYNIHGQILCKYWQTKGGCNHGDACQFLHESADGGSSATVEAHASTAGADQTPRSQATPFVSEGRTCYSCGALGHLSKDCPGVPAVTPAQQLNGDVSKILAANSLITLEDEEAFFTSLEHTNSQAFTDHQIHGKLSETTIRNLLQHAFAVRQASQEAMKLAPQTGQTEDYEKAASLDELAKEILNTPGLPLDLKMRERVVEVAARGFG
ncbi:uncharacterized protein CLAFUR5_10232 [Fulvia fulva]|uniref:Uncharacterized protein n=1 Tax=Passalora fulva TaxID=5499 RepID=A0A9Q8PC30_PASFU|nr:uncharacterized protein CLAFUR5_10232 [Fulvia fulva]UJO19714.1 hypothetical protein CLAFUR5_10232 [Fulvia fulva]